MDSLKWRKAAKAAFPYSLPVMAGYLILGFGFGLLLHSKGYSFVWAFVMAVTMFAGSGQYVAVDLLATGASLLTSGLVTFMINARHIFYGMSLLLRYRNMGVLRNYMIFGLTDETYSVVSHVDPPEGVDKTAFYFLFTLMNHIYWIIGCVAGAVFGTLVPMPTAGVDFSMTALFTVVVVENLMEKGKRATTFIGMGCTLLCLLIFGPDNFLIPAMIAIAVMLLVLRPIFDKEGKEK